MADTKKTRIFAIKAWVKSKKVMTGEGFKTVSGKFLKGVTAAESSTEAHEKTRQHFLKLLNRPGDELKYDSDDIMIRECKEFGDFAIK